LHPRSGCSNEDSQRAALVRNDTEIFFHSRRTMHVTMTDFYLQVFPDSSGNNL
jgi:hypothetical protein